MPGPPVFQRSPRFLPQVPKGEVELPAPPPVPHEPSMSAVMLLWSLIPGLLSALIMYFFSRKAGGAGGSYMLFSLPMMAAGALVQIGHHYLQKRKYIRDAEGREQKYRALLEAQRQALTRDREQHRQVMRQTDPDGAECLERVQTQDSRLWERSPRDEDFLGLRLGLGKTPFGIAIKTPKPPNAIDVDPLYTEAQHLANEFETVPGVPLRLSVRELGVCGVAGARTAVLSGARGLAVQVAVHHSPREVKVVALFPQEEAGEWAWLRWLPHNWTDDSQRRFLACDKAGARRVLTDLHELFQRRKQSLNGEPSRTQAAMPVPAYVFLIGDPRLVENEPLLPLLLREGAALGGYPVFLADRKEELPMECRGIVEVGSQFSSLIRTVPHRVQDDFLPDQVPALLAEQVARAMAPIRLNSVSASTEVPRKVTLLEMLGVTRVEGVDAGARWRSCQTAASLAVPIGAKAGGEPLIFDLHEKAHGPHGLVAGATGSGKSELLQSLIASLAVSFHPHELAFVMVDYKGGGMANAFKGLPHLAGTITNLEGNLARRALMALKSELKRRQRMLAEAGVAHIDEYIRQRRNGEPLDPLPHLVVVVDEFAELKAEQPDFMRELVSAVRVGRSLGVHLILATQKPAGVVDEQIWSNTRFRLCLRVERPEDSQEVLRCPDAASLTGAGRAYFQVGNNERFELFQAGYAGAPYQPDAAGVVDPYAVAEVGMDGRRYPLSQSQAPGVALNAPTQLQALVQYLEQVAAEAGITPLDGPWLPPLPAEVSLAEVRTGEDGWNGEAWRETERWLEPVIGLVDDPEQQRQGALRLALGRDGHLAVYGAPGSGKSTFLQTFICSLALDHAPADLHLYLVDGSGRSFSLFAGLPHVGAAIAGDEAERVRRLLRFLQQELAARKEALARAGVNTLAALRQAGEAAIPALVVMIDNYPAFASTFADDEEQLAQLGREGGNHGIHLVLAANSPSAVRHRVATNITGAVTLNLADRGEYAGALGRTNGMEPAPVVGRGLVKGAPPLEFQTALADRSGAEWERTAALRALCETMNQAWTGARPRPVRVLPDVVPLDEVISLEAAAPEPLRVPLGLAVESLEPFAVDLAEGPHFLVGGPPTSGKTTLLQSWVLALAAQNPADSLWIWLADLSAGGLAALKHLPHVQGYVTDGESASALVSQLAGLLQERRQAWEQARNAGADTEADDAPALLLVVDDYDALRNGLSSEARETLERLVRRERGLGFYSLVAGASSTFSQYGYESLCKAFKELPAGFVLGSNEHADLDLFNLRPLTGDPGKPLPPGLGYYTRRGRTRAVRVATPHAGDLPLAEWVARICARGVKEDAADRCPAG